jgi:hypothetical protein
MRREEKGTEEKNQNASRICQRRKIEPAQSHNKSYFTISLMRLCEKELN